MRQPSNRRWLPKRRTTTPAIMVASRSSPADTWRDLLLLSRPAVVVPRWMWVVLLHLPPFQSIWSPVQSRRLGHDGCDPGLRYQDTERTGGRTRVLLNLFSNGFYSRA